MRFIEMTGKTLREIVTEGELPAGNLSSAGIGDDSIVRINEQGDIEIRRRERWDVIGGLLGDFAARARQQTGLDWA